MVSTPTVNTVNTLGEFQDEIIRRMKLPADANDPFAGGITSVAPYIRKFGTPTVFGPGNVDDAPLYSVILSVHSSDADIGLERWTGHMILAVRLEAYCIRLLIGEENEADIPLDDAHKILYWAKYHQVEGMWTIPYPFRGGVDRVVIRDAEDSPVNDISRAIYRAWWDVEFIWRPTLTDDILPAIIDDGFGTYQDTVADIQVTLQ